MSLGPTVKNFQLEPLISSLPPDADDSPGTSQPHPPCIGEGRGWQGRAWESPPPKEKIIASSFYQLTLKSVCTNALLEMQMCPGRIKPMGHSEKNELL